MDKKFDLNTVKLGLVGLGYVGLPLAVSFANKIEVVGYDKSKVRIRELMNGFDATGEVDISDLLKAKRLKLFNEIENLKDCNCFIVAVPTPVDNNKVPDLSALENACKDVGSVLKSGDIIIFESTVFPGATEEICAPILEKVSGLNFISGSDNEANDGFYLGYSPERVNPGDKSRRITDIVKITSASTLKAAEYVDQLYKIVVGAGTHMAESIKIAEAAKIIENVQRDVNIALMNELSIVFNKMGISTQAVLKAAQTKWNFVPFYPGLVGGHCIGVDPYYLAHKSKEFGCTPEVILAGRRINEAMPAHTAYLIVKLMLRQQITLSNSRVLMLGATFKENCPDLRNSKSIALAQNLIEFGCQVDVIDPLVDDEIMEKLNVFASINQQWLGSYDAVVLAVPHQCFLSDGVEQIKKYQKKHSVFFDVRCAFGPDASDGSL